MSEELRIDDILVGERDRTDLGNIEELAASINEVGLLHPVVVTIDGELVAGDRRLAACKSLGWEWVAVTVVDLDTAEAVLKAEADENTCRKGLTPYEASRARERRAKLLAKKAAEKKAHGKTAPGKPKPDNASSNLDEASATARATRKLGAAGTGYSGSTLDKVDAIRDVAEKGIVRRGKEEIPVPEPVREVATKSLEAVKKTGAAIDRSSKELNAALESYIGADPNVQRARIRVKFTTACNHVLTLAEFDPDELAAAFGPKDWDHVDKVLDRVDTWGKSLRRNRLKVIGDK